MPCAAAVSAMYWRIDGPSASTFSSRHGRNLYPKVSMSKSQRIPGYRNKSQVPPIRARRSSTATVLSGNWAVSWQAVPIPDRPAPMIKTSKCCAVMAGNLEFPSLQELSVGGGPDMVLDTPKATVVLLIREP